MQNTIANNTSGSLLCRSKFPNSCMNTAPLTEKALRRKLTFVSDDQCGITRQRRGKGFTYLDAAGARITNPEILQRIKSLVIPPQWTNVWICLKPNGHMQATGRDQKNRKQYIYHPLYVDFRQNYKFRKLAAFAEKLPEIRQTTEAHLRKRAWTREKVLALIIRVLDYSGIRIGNRIYRNQNGTFGLTPLRRKHMTIEGDGMVFTYVGKSHKLQQLRLDDKKLVRLIKKCAELPGYEVFSYLDENGKSQPVDSEEVNEYIHEIAGPEYSSKDFRTWTATALAVYHYPEAKAKVDEKPRRNLETVLVKMVAKDLGNTPAVCRSYYIHPNVLEAARQGAISWTASDDETGAPSHALTPWEEEAYRIITAES